MIQPNANSSSFNPQSIPAASSDRCRHTTPTGRRCRLHADASSGFCVKHYQEHVAEIAATLTAGLDDLTSGEDIATFLSRLLLLTAQDKISPRRAAVLTYIASQLLRSVHTMIHEEKHKPMEIIFDTPRPKRDQPDDHDRSQPGPQNSANVPSSTAVTTKEKVLV